MTDLSDQIPEDSPPIYDRDEFLVRVYSALRLDKPTPRRLSGKNAVLWQQAQEKAFDLCLRRLTDGTPQTIESVLSTVKGQYRTLCEEHYGRFKKIDGERRLVRPGVTSGIDADLQSASDDQSAAQDARIDRQTAFDRIRPTLTPKERAVLDALAPYGGERPSVSQLARDAGVQRSTARLALGKINRMLKGI